MKKAPTKINAKLEAANKAGKIKNLLKIMII